MRDINKKKLNIKREKNEKKRLTWYCKSKKNTVLSYISHIFYFSNENFIFNKMAILKIIFI